MQQHGQYVSTRCLKLCIWIQNWVVMVQPGGRRAQFQSRALEAPRSISVAAPERLLLTLFRDRPAKGVSKGKHLIRRVSASSNKADH